MKDKWNRVLALAAAAALGLSIAGCGSTASAGSGDNKDAAGVLEPSSESADSIADAGVETNVQAESVHTDSTEHTDTVSASTDQTSTDSQGAITAESVESDTEDHAANSSTGGAVTVEGLFAGMSIEDKVAQLFVITPEQLTGLEPVTAAGQTTQNAINSYPVGGLIYKKENLVDTAQTTEMIANTQQYSKARTGIQLFTCVDEEGGTVRRISGNAGFSAPDIPDMADVGATGDVSLAGSYGTTIGSYLAPIGFNVDFAPDADVLTNPDNEVVARRSFGSDPNLVSSMAQSYAAGLESQGVLPCYKHYPGHGATTGDTHAGYAYSDRTLEQLQASELVPFQDAVNQGAQMIMAAHIAVPNVTGDETPASLSSTLVTDILRNQMGYKGIVITDDMEMGAIVNSYGTPEACVKAIEAGDDLLLVSTGFRESYQAVLGAVQSGRLTEARINESLQRILTVKQQMGLIG